jgi:hypothetical protein
MRNNERLDEVNTQLGNSIDQATGPISYFFITGAHKSGTTWVMRIMNHHPEVSVKEEGVFVGYKNSVDSWLNTETIRNWCSDRPRRKIWLRDYDDLDVMKAIKRGIIKELMKTILWQPGITAIGDKSPLFYCKGSKELADIFPDAKYYNIIRDGRDVAISHMFHILRLRHYSFLPEDEDSDRLDLIADYFIRGIGKKTSLLTEPSLRNFARKWKTSIEGAQLAKDSFGDNYFEIRYENLLEYRNSIIRDVFEHLGVNHSTEIVNECVAANDFLKASGRQPGVEDRSSFYRKGISGDWRNYFTKRDKQIFKDVAGDLLIKLGYENNNRW